MNIQTQASQNILLPLFMKLDGHRILVIGGGKIGLEKITAILRNDPSAALTVVAPEILPEITELSAQYDIRLHNRPFETDDLNSISLVFAATGLADVNKIIHAESRKRSILINVADTPALCDFYMSSIVIKGDLKIAISTNGKSPTLGKRMRAFLEEWLPDSIGEVMERLHRIRNNMKTDFEQKVTELNRLTKVFEESNKGS
ncbi:MAG: bifunctional precorrin-2 dehydrogenase/sirohydrochlorin ferrochelatase [Flavobacteriales bacterium]|nr:bifunctional precorrin-2 dehydrogenase/sirohydrochlorin ferrochelatase [Flavobacteriales bacterium]